MASPIREMGRYTAKPDAPKSELATGGGTNNDKFAVLANGRPVDNGLRTLWVTETALTTALNTSYMADQLSIFGLVMGIALLLSGIGFAVLAVGGALRSAEVAFKVFGSRRPESGGRAARPDRLIQPRPERRAASAARRHSGPIWKEPDDRDNPAYDHRAHRRCDPA